MKKMKKGKNAVTLNTNTNKTKGRIRELSGYEKKKRRNL